LVIVADDLVDNILPIAVDGTIKETAVIERFGGWQIGLTFGSRPLELRY
jgi:hypothetical protein